MTSFDDLDFSQAEPVQSHQPGTNGHHPADLHPEDQLLSCCLLDPQTLERAKSAGLSPRSFSTFPRQTVFQRMVEVYAKNGSLDITLLVDELKRKKELTRIGGYPGLTEMTPAVPSTLSAQNLIQSVRNAEIRREITRLGKLAIEQAESVLDPAELLESLSKEFGPTNPSANGLHPPFAQRRSLAQFQIPPDNDSSILLGNRYLNRGDGAIISGTSGIGKSSLTLLLAVLWSLGRPAFGINPSGPLRSLLIQSEDSDGDVAEVWHSIVHSLDLSPEDQALVHERVTIVCDRTSRGLAFYKSLKDHLAATSPDLVWINPLQAFLDGDITQSQDLGKFLREHLNSLNEPARFAYFLIHHTTKPATGKDRTDRLWHEVMYDMAGGAELINWARAILSLRPSETEGNFNLILAKRGRRAGLTQRIEDGLNTRTEPRTVIPLKHGRGTMAVPGRAKPTPIIFWEERDPDKAPPKDGAKGAGRPSKHDFNDYRTVFPAHTSLGLELAPLHRQLCANKQISKSTLFDVLKRWVEEGLVDVVETPQRPTRYRASKVVPFAE